MSPETDKRIPFALLVLRFFLAIFLLQWSIEKLILPNAAASIARALRSSPAMHSDTNRSTSPNSVTRAPASSSIRAIIVCPNSIAYSQAVLPSNFSSVRA